MDHQQALDTKASERYLLGEMSEPERFAFEAHYFACQECGEDVRAGAAMARGIKAVCAGDAAAETAAAVPGRDEPRRGWFGWLSPAALVPTAVALGLAFVTGYQALIVVPSLRHATSSVAASAIVLRAAARGEEPVVAVDRTSSVSVLAMDVNLVEPGAGLSWELTPADGSNRIAGVAQAPPPGAQLLLVVHNRDFRQAGRWTVVLRAAHGAEVGRYQLTVQLK